MEPHRNAWQPGVGISIETLEPYEVVHAVLLLPRATRTTIDPVALVPFTYQRPLQTAAAQIMRTPNR